MIWPKKQVNHFWYTVKCLFSNNIVNVKTRNPISVWWLYFYIYLFLAVPPTISREDLSGLGLSPKEVKIRVNNSLTLECEVHAIPAAGIRWYKDRQASHKDHFLQQIFVLEKPGNFFTAMSLLPFINFSKTQSYRKSCSLSAIIIIIIC